VRCRGSRGQKHEQAAENRPHAGLMLPYDTR
jgi:hypothetical protein